MTSLAAGKPAPLGASYDGKGVNFALFSAHAERVELCVFDEQGNEQRFDLPARSGDIWHGWLAAAGPGLRYGYRVHGPWDPAQGHRFNPAKLLIDPSAHRVEGDLPDDERLHGGMWQPDRRDSAAVAPKSQVVDLRYDWRGDKPPRTPWGETVIYEAHVKGLTLLNPQLPEAIRGTYKALGHPAMIAYFKSLGISALELLPVAQFASEPRLQRMGLSNYWGYNPLAWFALDPRYASDPDRALDEFRDAVKALHAAGIEVILDIVLNHSAEIDLEGPTVSLRGIDNRSYYWVREDGDYHNWTGCGNTLNLSHPGVVEWARQCLRFWVDECHVDGFRFDLASVMGRTPEFRQDAPLFEAIRRDSVLSQVKLIAEPWDIGPGNEANGEENRDGTNNNYSNNHGIEGLEANFAVIERRRASAHALLTTLLLAQGTPMLLAGDEQGHSQHGNNNAYCQDNALTWLDWRQANPGLTAFTAALIHLRRRIPALTRNRWWQEGDGNVRWLNRNAQPLTAAEWQQGAACMQIQLSDRWLLTLNATAEVVDMVLPEGEWRAVPPFAGEDNPVIMAVWHGPAHGVCVFQRS